MLCYFAVLLSSCHWLSVLTVCRQHLLEQAMEKDGLNEEQVCLLFCSIC